MCLIKLYYQAEVKAIFCGKVMLKRDLNGLLVCKLIMSNFQLIKYLFIVDKYFLIPI